MKHQPISLAVEFPHRAAGFTMQWAQLKTQIGLLGMVGHVNHLEMCVYEMDQDVDLGLHPEDLDVQMFTLDEPSVVRNWLADHGSDNLYEDGIALVLHTQGPELSIEFTSTTGGSVRVRSSCSIDLGIWRQLMLAMIDLWEADSAELSPQGKGWSHFPTSRSGAGWITYTELTSDWDPDVLTATRFGKGWVLDPLPGMEDRALDLAKAAIEAHAPYVSSGAEAARYRQYITGVAPLPNGRVPKLVVEGVEFDGYVERAGKPIYIQAIHWFARDLFTWKSPARLAKAFIPAAEAEAAAVAAVGTNGIIEWHTNHPLAAELLRDIVKHTGIQVHWTPMPPHQELRP